MRETIKVEWGNTSFEFLRTGDIYKISHKNLMINQLMGTPLDGSLMNLYLRIIGKNEIKYVPMIGIKSNSVFSYSKNQACFQGDYEGVSYQVTLSLAKENIWFWTIDLSGEGQVDVILGQDLGLGDKDAVMSNEAYISQYIDYCIKEEEGYGPIINARQNQLMSTGNPYLQLGAVTGARAFSTDGFQFFGISSRESGIPEALTKETLSNEVYQYEFAYAALQSPVINLKEKDEKVIFYGHFLADKSHANEAAGIDEEVLRSYSAIPKAIEWTKQELVCRTPYSYLESQAFSEAELDSMYPKKRFQMEEDSLSLSFFLPDYSHVVLKEKELLTERPHAHMVMNLNASSGKENTIASTCYMYGVFNSQIVLGNTSNHMLLSNNRNHLNLLHTSGQRIWIREGGKLFLLAVPSLFEVGANYGRWYYKILDDILEITTYTTVEFPEVHMVLSSQKGKRYDFIVTNYIVGGNDENQEPGTVKQDGEKIYITPHQDAFSEKIVPGVKYGIRVLDTEFEMIDDGIFYQDGRKRNAHLLVLKIEKNSGFHMIFTGSAAGEINFSPINSFALEKDHYEKIFKEFTREFHIQEDFNRIFRLNATVYWFAHNALFHYKSPHGVEQFQGAAWGTRDVCQGPLELSIALGHYEDIREILETVYSHQYLETGNWPQWFMFDQYFQIQQEESHGDIIVWPLKALTDYLQATGDFEILNKELPYTQVETKAFTNETQTLKEHVLLQLGYIKKNLMYGTALSNYGNGDWDDTLQPANPQLRSSLISSWTVALTYETMKSFGELLKDFDPEWQEEIETFTSGIKEDFYRYLIKDKVISGFALMKEPGDISYLLHPEDESTGIKYRLLPMTRAIIAGLFTKELAEQHLELIDQYLTFPDGVRLMSEPVEYRRGEMRHFKRGELAANFGREIGLLYVHSNVRYSQALTKFGLGEKGMDALEKITPIGLEEKVQNAAPRQSNLYFSSSDGDFLTRFEVDYDKLKNGSKAVKGGWRLYSSGPGIFIHQLICNCLGIRQTKSSLIIDPVLPEDMLNISFQLNIEEYKVVYEFYLKSGKMIREVLINDKPIEFAPMLETYREGGAVVDKKRFMERLSLEQENIVRVYC